MITQESQQIQIICPKCKKVYLSEKSMIGEKFQCYGCGFNFNIPNKIEKITESIKCPFCKKLYNVAENILGKRVKCNNCEKSFTAVQNRTTPSDSLNKPNFPPIPQASGSLKEKELIQRLKTPPPLPPMPKQNHKIIKQLMALTLAWKIFIICLSILTLIIAMFFISPGTNSYIGIYKFEKYGKEIFGEMHVKKILEIRKDGTWQETVTVETSNIKSTPRTQDGEWETTLNKLILYDGRTRLPTTWLELEGNELIDRLSGEVFIRQN